MSENLNSAVGIVARLREGRLKIPVRLPVGSRDVHVLQTVKSGSGSHPVSCLVGIGESLFGDTAKLITHTM